MRNVVIFTTVLLLLNASPSLAAAQSTGSAPVNSSYTAFVDCMDKKIDEKTAVVFSALSGRVTENGIPVSDVQLIRIWDVGLTGESGKDQTITDSAGTFTFPPITRKLGLRKWLPHEPFIEQTIKVARAEKVIDVWMTDKRNYYSGGEIYKDKSNPIGCLHVEFRLDAPLEHTSGIYGRLVVSK